LEAWEPVSPGLVLGVALDVWEPVSPGLVFYAASIQGNSVFLYLDGGQYLFWSVLCWFYAIAG
jgi:hypothetical protein